jgi:hypothetical protein
MIAYRFTIRPASSYHCPPGWLDITPLVPDQQWNYGTVTYPEPLTFEVAQHWSLDPDTGPRISEVLVDGEPVSFSGVFASADERGCARIRYELAIGVLTPADLHRLAAARSAEFDVAIVLTIDENERGESLPFWKD